MNLTDKDIGHWSKKQQQKWSSMWEQKPSTKISPDFEEMGREGYSPQSCLFSHMQVKDGKILITSKYPIHIDSETPLYVMITNQAEREAYGRGYVDEGRRYPYFIPVSQSEGHPSSTASRTDIYTLSDILNNLSKEELSDLQIQIDQILENL